MVPKVAELPLVYCELKSPPDCPRVPALPFHTDSTLLLDLNALIISTGYAGPALEPMASAVPFGNGVVLAPSEWFQVFAAKKLGWAHPRGEEGWRRDLDRTAFERALLAKADEVQIREGDLALWQVPVSAVLQALRDFVTQHDTPENNLFDKTYRGPGRAGDLEAVARFLRAHAAFAWPRVRELAVRIALKEAPDPVLGALTAGKFEFKT